MGIAVYEHAPDAETLLLSDNVATVASDDEAEAAAEAALSTVDSDFGRTTDPVRMYMREMGSVELLTREGEIEIAKRIEDGLKDMIQAISACPTTIAEIIAAADRIPPTKSRSTNRRRPGRRQPEEGEAPVAAPAPRVRRDEDETKRKRKKKRKKKKRATPAPPASRPNSWSSSSANALEKFDDHRRAIRQDAQGLREGRLQLQGLRQGAGSISNELLGIRFTAKVVEKLCDTLRGQVDEVRHIEKQILDVAVNKCGMPRAHFIKVFPGNETNLHWVDGEVAANHPTAPSWAATCRPSRNCSSADRPAGARRAAAAGPAQHQQARWRPVK
jgi:RNA polymerase primary sigma factor